MTKKSERDPRDESAPAAQVTGDATERHLLKARELLREARTRLDSRDDEASDSSNEPSSGGDSEESHD